MTAGRKHHTITDGELGIINKHRRDTREDWEFGRREIIRYQREECLREQTVWGNGEGNGAHSSILVWEIPWTEEAGGLQSMGSQKSWT